jgi:DNA helicase IV
VFFVGDSRQQIYERNDLLERLAKKFETKTLTKHYRNGIQICTVADVIGKNFGVPPIIGSCNYDERKAKSSAVFGTYSDSNELIAAMVGRIEPQLRAYPNDLIGILCPNNADVDLVRLQLSGMQQMQPYLLPTDEEFHNPFSPDQRIYISTMHKAKGLEFRAAHLPFVEHVVNAGRKQQKKLSYTSVTRAKTSLSVYNIKDIPGYLSSARDAVSPKRATPVTVGALLPGKAKK